MAILTLKRGLTLRYQKNDNNKTNKIKRVHTIQNMVMVSKVTVKVKDKVVETVYPTA